jgi:predicted metal-dependent phosphoesterase TrpH
MSPRKITAQAKTRNIGMLAICDHNSSQNAPAVIRAARAEEVVVLPGMEVCTKEEIHVLGIFADADAALELQAMVHEHLPGRNDPEVFGPQVVANEFDEVVEFEERLLMGASDLAIERVVDEIHRLGGIVIASHVDRESYSVFSRLGFIPEALRFDALELTCHIRDSDARDRFAAPREVPFVRSSDAHRLEDLGTNTSEYLMERPTLQELRMALRRQQGRTVCAS